MVSDPDAMTRCVIEAVQQSGVYAILSKGWSDRLQLKKSSDISDPEMPLPPEMYPIKSIPHDWLFERIDAACHHGGAGTTGASLRAGIPTVIKPFFGDQFFWGDRVEALGVGSCVRKLTVEGLAEALVLATTDVKQIAKAKLVGEKIRSVGYIHFISGSPVHMYATGEWCCNCYRVYLPGLGVFQKPHQGAPHRH